MGYKINLGSGFKRYDGFLNIDDDPLVNPDYIVTLDDPNVKLPFEDNSVEEIKAEHILEHINNFIPLMKELYRVAEHGCILDIIAPNENHSVYYADPTHVRPINVNVMYMFSKKFIRDHIREHNSSTGMALKYDIDWEVIHYEFEYDPFYIPILNDFFARKEKGEVSPEEDFAIQRLLREANNVAMNNRIKCVAVKE